MKAIQPVQDNALELADNGERLTRSIQILDSKGIQCAVLIKDYIVHFPREQGLLRARECQRRVCSEY